MRSRAPARGEGSRGRAWCPPGREPPALHPAAPGGQRPPSLPTRGKEPRPGPGAARRRGARRHFSPMLWSFHGTRPWSEAEWSCVCARVCAQACACELVRARTRTRSFSPSAEGRVARPDALRSPPARPVCVPCISSTSRGGLGDRPPIVPQQKPLVRAARRAPWEGPHVRRLTEPSGPVEWACPRSRRRWTAEPRHGYGHPAPASASRPCGRPPPAAGACPAVRAAGARDTALRL